MSRVSDDAVGAGEAVATGVAVVAEPESVGASAGVATGEVVARDERVAARVGVAASVGVTGGIRVDLDSLTTGGLSPALEAGVGVVPPQAARPINVAHIKRQARTNLFGLPENIGVNYLPIPRMPCV